MWSWKWAIITLGPPFLVVLGFVGIPIVNYALYSPRSFDGERWKDGDPRQRMRMTGDLNNLLAGKTRAEVIDLLGPPDRDGVELVYEVMHGDVIGLFEMRELLLIHFDNSGRFQKFSYFD